MQVEYFSISVLHGFFHDVCNFGLCQPAWTEFCFIKISIPFSKITAFFQIIPSLLFRVRQDCYR